jgi:hypothetical protein
MRRLHVLAAFLGTLMACKTVSAMTCGSVGNGGGGGFINYDSENGVRLKEALRNGFAASSTDTGHRGNNDDFSFARGHREQGIDYHYRAIHETELAANGACQIELEFYNAHLARPEGTASHSYR